MRCGKRSRLFSRISELPLAYPGMYRPIRGVRRRADASLGACHFMGMTDESLCRFRPLLPGLEEKIELGDLIQFLDRGHLLLWYGPGG